MKLFNLLKDITKVFQVTPFTGVWVEIPCPPYHFYTEAVTPFTGVWVEISGKLRRNRSFLRHTFHGCVG